MILNNLNLVPDNVPVSIKVDGTKITYLSSNKILSENDPVQLSFKDAIVFPGLINSHDHLEFNLFPSLGDKTYNNYTEWGKQIHHYYKKEIEEVINIPEPLRAEWGVYKNLLCGVTTVVNHGKRVTVKNPLINVLQSFQDLHSVKFEKYWKLKLNNFFKKNTPCVIHAGEGTDDEAAHEIDELIKWNLFKRGLIAVHGVAMNKQQALKFKALVWCPVSNYFLFNKTAAINELKNSVQIIFGTDSTLTGSWNIWEHIGAAKNSGLVNDIELFEMLNKNPANTWKLDPVSISPGNIADIVIAKTTSSSQFPESFYSLDAENILMVIHQGNIRLLDEELYDQLNNSGFNLNNFYKIEINKTGKYVQGDLPGLMANIKSYHAKAIFPITTCEN